MEFKLGKKLLDIDLPKLNIDKRFTIYDKKTKRYIPADYIQKRGLPDHHFNLALCGSPGSGKTSTMVSLVTSNKPTSKVYRGCFDKIILCCDYTSLRSIKGDPFSDIPENQIFTQFDMNFINSFAELVTEFSGERMDTLLIIDDACMRLRSSKCLHDAYLNLLLTHRHLKFSTMTLVQDIMQLSLPLRNAMNGLILWKQINNKRQELIREEYLNMSIEDYRKFIEFVYQKPHDCLYIKLSRPPEFYKNFTPIETNGELLKQSAVLKDVKKTQELEKYHEEEKKEIDDQENIKL